MQMIARMAVQPRLHPRMFVGPVVVNNQMEIQFRRCMHIDLLQKSDELLMPMPWHAITDDPPIKHA